MSAPVVGLDPEKGRKRRNEPIRADWIDPIVGARCVEWKR